MPPLLEAERNRHAGAESHDARPTTGSFELAVAGSEDAQVEAMGCTVEPPATTIFVQDQPSNDSSLSGVLNQSLASALFGRL